MNEGPFNWGPFLLLTYVDYGCIYGLMDIDKLYNTGKINIVEYDKLADSQFNKSKEFLGPAVRFNIHIFDRWNQPYSCHVNGFTKKDTHVFIKRYQDHLEALKDYPKATKSLESDIDTEVVNGYDCDGVLVHPSFIEPSL